MWHYVLNIFAMKVLSLPPLPQNHYDDVIMDTMASQITSLAIVYSTVYSGADQRKHQSSASLAFVRGIHRRPVNSPHKLPVTRKMIPFDDVIMGCHLADDTFKCTFTIENFCILIRISLKFVPKGPKGDKPLPEPMVAQFTDAFMWHYG